MKDALWVFRTFGWKAGIRFVLNTLERKLKKRIEKPKKVPTFEELSDDEAESTAWAAGLSDWQRGNRQSLNKAWNDFVKRESN